MKSGREAAKEALLEAAQAAVDDSRRKADEAAARRRRSSRRRAAWSVWAVLLIGSAYLLVIRPSWYLTPPPPPESAEIQDASARLVLVREAARVNEYLAANGRLPSTLAEAGSMTRGVGYEVRDDGTYLLQASMEAGRTIALSSTDSVETFLGSSVRVVSSRGR